MNLIQIKLLRRYYTFHSDEITEFTFFAKKNWENKFFFTNDSVVKFTNTRKVDFIFD